MSDQIVFEINGVEQSYKKGTLRIASRLGQARRDCSFEVDGYRPLAGSYVRVGLNDLSHLLFAGEVSKPSQTFRELIPNSLSAIGCIDLTFRLNRRLVWKSYVNQSATAIYQDLIDNYTTGFTYAGVVASLPVISITFDGIDVMTCFQRVASAINGFVEVGYDADIAAFITDTGTAPDTLNDTCTTLFKRGGQELKASFNIESVRTRVIVTGKGAKALVNVAAGETILPLDDVTIFESGGGKAVISSNRIVYTGKDAGGGGSLVGTGASPANAPVATVVSGTGVESGIHNWAVTFVTVAGESLPSPLVVADVGHYAAPATPTVLDVRSGTGLSDGQYTYAVTFITAAGETTPGPTSQATAYTASDAVTAPGTPTRTEESPLVSGGVGQGIAGDSLAAVSYAVTFLDASGGETTPGSSTADITPTVVMNGMKGVSQYGVSTNGAGNVNVGSHNYRISIVTANGETSPDNGSFSGDNYTKSITVSTSAKKIRVGMAFDYGISNPNAELSRVTAVKIYRTAAGGSTYKLVSSVPFPSGWVDVGGSQLHKDFDDDVADASLGATLPTTDTAQGTKIDLTSIPTSSDSRVTKRRIYRTANGGSQLKLVTTINDNTTTTYTDTTPDSSLGANAPTSNTTNSLYHKIHLASIPLGPTGVTQRKLYRTVAGGSQLKFLATIADNSTTTYDDTTADGSLGSNAPSSNTTTGNKVSLSSIPTGQSSVTSRKLYRTVAAGSQLKLLHTIADNSTTTYDDTTADASLGANAPTSDASGLTQPNGQVIAGSTTVVVASAANFRSGGGWAVAGSQVIRYTGTTGTSLTGVPATGVGSVGATINYGTTITTAPSLLGVTGLTYEWGGAAGLSGDLCRIMAVADDTTAQGIIGSLERDVNGDPTDGIHEFLIKDESLILTADCLSRAQIDLQNGAVVQASIEYESKDTKSKVGRVVPVDLPGLGLSGSFTIQSVEFDDAMEYGGGIMPHYVVQASNTRFRLEDMIRFLAQQAA